MFLEIVTKYRETKPTVIFTWDYLGPVHTYSDILENGLFSSVFQKKIRVLLTGSVLESFSPVSSKSSINGNTMASLTEHVFCE